MPAASAEELVLPKGRLAELFRAVRARGYRVIGPKLEERAIVYAELRDASELPEGWTDEQAPGHYRAARRSDAAVFGYAVGPRSFRAFFQQARQELVTLRRDARGAAAGVEPLSPVADARPLALFGARGCDISALAVLDRVLAGGAHVDPRYAARRRGALIVAVDCNEPSSTCFCIAQGGGPRAEQGFDLALRELVDGPEHCFLLRVGSERGAELVEALALEGASAQASSRGVELDRRARARMTSSVPALDAQRRLQEELEHPEWDAVASRCLACTNCTMVCPTCFCTTTEDGLDVSGQLAARAQRHDSCFSREYSHVHGGAVRDSIKSRYRQWLVHKFSSWYDQFGSSGCVGCGRCISACPAGIDVRQELARIVGHAP